MTNPMASHLLGVLPGLGAVSVALQLSAARAGCLAQVLFDPSLACHDGRRRGAPHEALLEPLVVVQVRFDALRTGGFQ